MHGYVDMTFRIIYCISYTDIEHHLVSFSHSHDPWLQKSSIVLAVLWNGVVLL